MTTSGRPALSALPQGWRAYGVALLPLALAGTLPWWAVALLCALFGAGVRFPAWAEARLLASLGTVALAAALGARQVLGGSPEGAGGAGLLQHWRDLGALYTLWLLGIGLLHWAATLLTEGRRTGLWLLLGAGLISPHPALLAALLGGALARPGPDDRHHSRAVPSPPVRWGTLAALGLLPLLALALPRGAVLLGQGNTPAVNPAARATPASPPLSPLPPAPGPTGSGAPPQTTFSDVAWLPPFPLELFLFGFLPLLLLLAGAAWRYRFRRGKRPTLPELLMAAGLVLTFLVALALSLGGQGAGPGLGDPGAGPSGGMEGGGLSEQEARQVRLLNSYVNLALWLSFVVYLLLVVALAWTWWQARDMESRPLPPDALGEGDAGTGPPAEPLHRVREAYRRAETLLTASGRGRGAPETTLGYAARLSAQDAALSVPLGVLARAYQPVRYGGRVSEEDAVAAEEAARTVARLLPTLPHRGEPPELDSGSQERDVGRSDPGPSDPGQSDPDQSDLGKDRP